MAGRKIFISYKYADSNVASLAIAGREQTTARHYVDVLQALIDADDHINKGENDNESLAQFKDSTIGTKLKGKIYDSSVTVVLLSPNMNDPFKSEEDQWIPWEISWSLRELTKDERVSGANAMLAVALPDASNSYAYAVAEDNCPYCHCNIWQTNSFFRIIRENMFNRKKPNLMASCAGHQWNPTHSGNDHSFIYPVKWSTFISSVGVHINIACGIQKDIDSYNLRKIP